MDHQILNGDIEYRRSRDGQEQCNGNIFAWVAGLAGSDERRVKAGVRIHHQEHGFEPSGLRGMDRGRMHASAGMESQSGKTCNDKEAEQADFGDSKKIAELI